MKSWIATKIIFERCKEKGFGLSILDRQFTQEEIEGLANYTVAMALRYFRTKVLMKRRWDPTKGASIRTFFVGQCIFQFPNIYREWLLESEGRLAPRLHRRHRRDGLPHGPHLGRSTAR